MSLSELPVVMDRISAATPWSPIAVFKSSIDGKVDAVFGATVLTQERIRMKDPKLIGVYDASMNRNKVADEIRKAMA